MGRSPRRFRDKRGIEIAQRALIRARAILNRSDIERWRVSERVSWRGIGEFVGNCGIERPHSPTGDLRHSVPAFLEVTRGG